MAEKGKPPDAVPIVFGEAVSIDSWLSFGPTGLDHAIDRAFDAILTKRMRLLDEEIMNGPVSPPLGIFDGHS